MICMTLKILIADDEPKIRNGLAAAVDWEALGMAVVGLARDGEDALQIAAEALPDICLVDICMPIVNGIELIEQLKQTSPAMLPIIITGHDEFEYAQQAVKLKVFDYILKPVNEEELFQILQKAKAELETAREREARYRLAEQQLQKNLPALRQRLVADWLEGQLTVEEFREESDFYRIQLEGAVGLLMIQSPGLPVINHLYDEKERQLLLFALTDLLEEALAAFRPHVALRNPEDNLVALATVRDRKSWEALQPALQTKAARIAGREVAVLQDWVPGGTAGVCAAYREMQKSLRREHCLPIIQKVKDLIAANYHDPELGLHKIAAAMQVSLSYLSKLFKQETGQSFTDYLIKIRIREAMQRMNQPQLKVYEIAEQVGYGSQHYFCAAFKKVLGVTPTEYRQKNI